MRTIKSFILIISLLVPTLAFAQGGTQAGYVKTPGRLNKGGRIISGTYIPNASITLKGGTSVRSSSSGAFSFTLSSGTRTFALQKVQKIGYQLVDPDVLKRQYDCNPNNKLVILMDNPTTITEYKLEQEKKLRKTIQNKLIKRESELEQTKNQLAELKRKNKLTNQEYEQKLQECEQKLQELLASQESCERMIQEMAELYSKMDFDQDNEVNRLCVEYLLNGQLEQLDSLIKSKGDLNDLESSIRDEQALEKQRDDEIRQQQATNDQAKAGTRKKLEELAQLYFYKSEMYKLQCRSDSAVYLLVRRAYLDTTNVAWQLDAGMFIEQYGLNRPLYRTPFDRDIRMLEQSVLANSEEKLLKDDLMNLANTYYERAYEHAVEQFGKESEQAAECLVHLGDLWAEESLECFFDSINDNTAFTLDELEDVLPEYFTALSIYEQVLGTNNEASANLLRKIALTIFRPYAAGFFNGEAQKCALNALDIIKQIYGTGHPVTASAYIDCGNTEYYSAAAIKDFETAKQILDEYDGEKRKELIYLYKSIAAHSMIRENYIDRVNAQSPYYLMDFDSKAKNDKGELSFTDFQKEDWEDYQNYQDFMEQWTEEQLDEYTTALQNYEQALQLIIDLYGTSYYEVTSIQATIEYLRKEIDQCQTTIKNADAEIIRINQLRPKQ